MPNFSLRHVLAVVALVAVCFACIAASTAGYRWVIVPPLMVLSVIIFLLFSGITYGFAFLVHLLLVRGPMNIAAALRLKSKGRS